MQTAKNVARWLLSRNDARFDEGDADYISNLKLQKLLYYAQGLYLGTYGTPLFQDDLVAWKHGPVVESVYDEYKSNHANGITTYEPPCENFTNEEDEVLAFTLDNFGQYTAWKLRDMTHQEKPWMETPRNAVISNELIKTYFKENYVQ